MIAFEKVLICCQVVSMVLDIHVVSNIKSIYDIDTVRQTFSVEAKYKLRWNATEKDRANWNSIQATKHHFESKSEDISGNPEETHQPNTSSLIPARASVIIASGNEEFIPEFMPRIVFPNASNAKLELKAGNKIFYKFVEAGGKYDEAQIVFDFQIKCSFREFFELDAFPYDCQDLPVIMKLGGDADCKHFRFVPDGHRAIFGKMELDNSVFTEWTVHPTVYEFGFTDVSLSKKGKTYPLYINRIKVQRKSGFYIQRVVLVLAFLSLSALSSFSVEWDNEEDRLGIDFTILLTVVAFQYVINSSLPVLPFLTIIDLYILSTMGFIIWIIFAQSLLIRLVSTDDDEEESDRLFFWISFVIWVVMQVAFVGYSPFISNREKQKLTMNSMELEQHIKKEQNKGVVAHKMKFKAKDIEIIKSGKWCSGIGEQVLHSKGVSGDATNPDQTEEEVKRLM